MSCKHLEENMNQVFTLSAIQNPKSTGQEKNVCKGDEGALVQIDCMMHLAFHSNSFHFILYSLYIYV